jgi:phage portal protein BeeE
MNKLLIIFFFLASLFTAYGQNYVQQGEYFWDTDPGTGNGTALLATDGNFDTALENLFKNGIDVTALSTGAHSFQVRVRGVDGTWSSLFKQTIYIQAAQTTVTRAVNVVMGEYFWDTDPGNGNGTPVLALDGAFNSTIEEIFNNGISVSALGIGAHSFNVRIKGYEGTWGAVFKQTIYVENTASLITRSVKVNQAEYFWDTDPGTGNGTILLAFDGNYSSTIEDLFKNGIAVSSLSLGAHSFQVRVQGLDGTWSTLFKQTIFIEATPTLVTRTIKVTQAEYFWDTDPGTGNATVLLATDGNFSSSIEDVLKNGILVSSLSLGAHSFQVRVKGNDGTWSSLFKQTIHVDSTPVAVTRNVKLLQGEFFWDTDPGIGNGTPLLALDGNFNSAIEHVLLNGINVSSLSLGAHSFQVRVKGNNGTWSTVFKQTIYLEGPLVSVSRTVRLLQGEYFWDTDPGVGNGTMLIASDGNFDTALENLLKNNIDVSSLSLGAHSFRVRVKGQDNSWSQVFKQTIFIECASPTAAAISISSTQNGQCEGSQNVFNATVTNGGTAPTFTWKVNGTVVGTNSATLIINTLNNGDIVTCELVSNSACASPNSAVSNALPITLSPIVTPTISISSSGGSAVCTGTSVTYTASVTNGGSSPLYQWKLNGINVGLNSNQYTTSNLNNGDVITCELTSSLNCTSPTTVVSSGITMSVTNIVTPYISITASNSIICQGTTVIFTASGTNGGASPIYQWKVNGINVGTNSTTYSNSALQNGDIVSCVLTSSLGCLTSTTATSNTITMSVSPSVAASVSISTSSSTTICQGTTVTFDATAVNGGLFPSYQWQVNGFNAGYNQASFSSASLANGDVVSCVMTSTASCPTPASSLSNAISMTVNSSAAPSVSITSNQGTSICTGASIICTATVTNGGTTPSYQWKVNGINAGTNSSTFASSSISQGDIITCVVTSNATCVNGQTATSNALSFTVTSIVTPSVSISVSSTSICNGSSASFTATPTNGGATPTYQWKLNGINAGINSPTFTSSSLQNGDIVSCVMSSSLPCITSANVTSNTITMSVVSSAPTSVSITSSNGSSVCQGSNTIFSASPTNGGLTPSYQWQLNGTNVGTNAASYSTASLTSGDVVVCYMTSSESCASPLTSVSNSITITIIPTTAPTVTISCAQGTSICAGTSVFFTATPTNGGSSPNYQWKINGTNVGPNSAFFNTNTLVQGDIVTCIVTSNATCVNGQTATSNALVFNVTSNVTPSVSITASATTSCAGSSVSFTASPTNGGTTPSYQWNVNGSNVGTNSSTYSTSSLQNGDMVTCVLTSSLNCVTNNAVTSNGITMTINTFSPVSVTINSSVGTTICQGTSASFTATPINGGTSPAYQWQVNGFNVGTNASTYTSSSIANGDIVSCILTSNATCPSPISASSNSIAMTVNTVSPPTVSISSNQGTSICAGTSVVLTAAGGNGGSSPSYQWQVNGNNVGTNQAFYTSNTLTQGDIVTCIITSNANCVNGQTASSNSLVFTVSSIVTPSVSISASSTTICSGSSASFTATPTNGGASPSYQWQVNGNNVGNNSANYSSSSLQNGDIVTCVLYSSLPCVSNSSATSNAVAINVLTSTPTSISISSSVGTTICQGTSATFTAIPTNGGINPIYQWQINGSNVGSNMSTFSSSSLQNGDQITCFMSSSETCPNPSNAASNVILMTVNPVITPSISITSNPFMPVCVDDAVVFQANTLNGGLTPVYQWTINGIDQGVNAATFSSSTLNNGDQIQCSLTANPTCASTTSAFSNMIVYSTVFVDVSVTVAGTQLSANQSGATYQWIDCNNGNSAIAGANSQIFTATQNGLYAVIVSLGVCSDTSICYSVNNAGLFEDQFYVEVYPNPTIDFTTIKFSEPRTYEIVCHDIAGRIVRKWSGFGETEILNLSDLGKANYILSIQCNDMVIRKQISVISDNQ